MKGLLKLPLAIVNVVYRNLPVTAIVIAVYLICQTEILQRFNSSLGVVAHEARWVEIAKLIGLTWLLAFLKERFSLRVLITVSGILIMIASMHMVFAIPLFLISLLIPSSMLGTALFFVLVLYYLFVC